MLRQLQKACQPRCRQAHLYKAAPKRENWRTMRNQLVIHGHFYQPPRENPWTGLIPSQSSASPYENWNARIMRECYAANAASRFLDSNGNILDILNNYSHISFNFGPTLLAWIKAQAPLVYARILEADAASCDRNRGHGNAIAQAYNHSILPLARPEDIETQIVWGLKDFESHFDRPAEGMWLPEAAVNPAVADALIAHRLKFVILSPWQAQAYSPAGSGKWQALGGNPIPSDRAYRLERPAGSIAVFFYNHHLSQGISFEHYLRNADFLYARLLEFHQGAREDHLVNIATDGEVYGHHEPFGDMCLAALVKAVQAGSDFRLTNYGSYLEQSPPRYLVALKEGEEGLGTSWSCSHGVARWLRDCGCSLGGREGWNQKWRTPLRQALDNLQENLNGIFARKMPELSSTAPRELRNLYISVLSGTESAEAFAARHLDRAPASDPGARSAFYSLLEGQRLGMFMFTSCGWFFADLAGIETVQNMAFAARAADLYAPFAEENLLEGYLTELEMGRSNLKSAGTGRDIVESMVLPLRQGLAYGAAIFVYGRVLASEGGESPSQGQYRLGSLQVEQDDGVFTGEIEVSLWPLLEKKRFFFRVDPQRRFSLELDGGSEGGQELPVATGELPAQLKTRLLQSLAENLLSPAGHFLPGSVGEIISLLEFARGIGEPLPPSLARLSELALEIMVERIANHPGQEFFDQELPRIDRLAQLMRQNSLSIDQANLEKRLSRLISALAESLPEAQGERPLLNLCSVLKACRRIGLKPELTRAQNTVLALLNRGLGQDRLAGEAEAAGARRVRSLAALASALQISVEPLTAKLLELSGLAGPA